jgi:hypothetical protein
VGHVQVAQNAINSYAPAVDRQRLRIAVTETNSADWSGKWPHVNDLGHALALFDIFGAHLRHPSVEFTQLWNTRWSGNDSVATPALWDAVDKNNELQATGRAAAIWGEFLKDTLVSSSSTARVRTYASYAPATKRLSVFLINKDTVARSVSVTTNHPSAGFLLDTWVFSGSSPQDVQPTWTPQGRSWNAGNVISVTLPAVSVTVLDLTPDGRVHAVPGMIQAEDFSAGGYWDATPGNSGGVYRATDVDIEATTDAGGGFNVGWISAGEWLDYTIHVPKAGFYDLTARIASPHSGKTMRFLLNGQSLTGDVAVSLTGGWQKWQSVRQSVQLPAGTHRLTLMAVTNGFNVNWISLTTAAGPTHVLPATIQAEDFLDDAYWDSTAGNAGGVYRQTDVDLQATTDAGGGFNVGWITAGEWLEYAVHINTAGYFDLAARIASPHSGKSFAVLVSNVNVTGNISVPNTGGHQSWRTVTHTRVYLPAGGHRLRVATSTGQFNLNWISLAPSP